MLLEVTQRRTTHLSLTPLIDVVFLLLIFFMLSSTFLKYSSLNISGGTASAGNVKPGEIALIRLHENGKIDFNGSALQVSELVSKLNAFAQEGGKKAILKIMEGITVQNIVALLEQAKQSKIQNIMIIR